MASWLQFARRLSRIFLDLSLRNMQFNNPRGVMSNKFRQLNFSLLPVIEYAGVIIQLERDVDERLCSDETRNEFYDRARAALMFFFAAKEDGERWINDAMLRAGLNEFYAMEDAARRWLLAGHSIKLPTFAGSANPLIHLMYMLRHLNVHTKPTPSRVEDVTVIFRPNTTAAQEITYGSVMLDEMTTSDIRISNEIRKFYSVEDIERILGWLMENQRIFGIAEIFNRGLHAYCREVLDSAGA
jgi:hypothetical protein